MQVGRDNITQVTYASTTSDSNAGRVRAVTASVEKTPFGDNLWMVRVNNGTRGPIGGLGVVVYTVDDLGTRTTDGCVPAKDRVSITQMFQDIAGQAFQGMFGALEQHARMDPMMGMMGMSPGAFAGLSSYGPSFAAQLTSTPQAAALRQMQGLLADSFPEVVTAEQHAEVLYLVEGEGQVQVDIEFEDEDGNRWVRPFNQPPRRGE